MLYYNYYKTMKNTIRFLHDYIDENAVYTNWDTTAQSLFSLALAGSFEYSLVNVLDEQVLFLKPTESTSIAKLQKWSQMIREKSGYETVLVLDEASPYIIKKLLKDKTAFLIAGKQISLPFLAMRIKKDRNKTSKEVLKFGPATQMTFLFLLYSEEEVFYQEIISRSLGISSMTAARAMNDLVSLGLISYDIVGKTGRKREYHRLPKEEFYRIGKKYLTDPIKKTIYIDIVPSDGCIVKSDLTALAEQTLLADPEQERYAIYDRNKKILDGHIIQKDKALIENLPIMQLMKYDISKLTKNGCIDPVSLMLSLTENDERIEMAIEELMKEKSWYEE